MSLVCSGCRKTEFPLSLRASLLLTCTEVKKSGAVKSCPSLSRIDQVQLVRQAAAKPELVWKELIFDHPDLDALGTRPVNRRCRGDVSGNVNSDCRNYLTGQG